MELSREPESSKTQFQIPDLVLVADEVGARRLSNLSIVGKICSNKSVSKNVVVMILRRIWFTEEHIKIEQLGNNFFLFSFKNEQDRNRVWMWRPWSVNGTHLLLREWNSNLALSNIDFNLSSFWVQIHGLPMRFMTKQNAIRIRGLFPKVLQWKSPTRTNIMGFKYIRMEVEIDVQKPISSGFHHVIENKGC